MKHNLQPLLPHPRSTLSCQTVLTTVPHAPFPYKILVSTGPAVNVTVPNGQLGTPNGSIGSSPKISMEHPTFPGAVAT
jgi:hypothetical protein